MRSRWVAVWAVAVLAVVPAQAWTQWQGGSERHGVIALPSEPVDVVDLFNAHAANLSTAGPPGATYVTTPDGVVALANDDQGACILLRWVDDLAGAPEEIPLDACRFGSLHGYAEAQDFFAVCSAGPAEDAAFQLRDAKTGRLVFRVALARSLDGLPLDDGSDGDAVWSCHGVALDDQAGRAIVPVAATRGGVDAFGFQVLEVRLSDGGSDVLYPMEVDDGVPGPPIVMHQGDGSALAADAVEFWPRVATVAGDGAVITGVQRWRDAGDELVPGLLWIPQSGGTSQGEDLGAIFAPEGTPGWRGSAAATSDGRLAMARVGDHVILVDPLAAEPVRSSPLPVFDPESEEDDSLLAGMPPPLWQDGVFYLPTRSGITALDGEDLSGLWHWPGLGRSWVVGNAMVTTGDEVVAIVYDTGGASDGHWHGDALLVRIDVFTGQPVQIVPLPLRSGWFTMPALDCADSAYAQGYEADGAYFCPDSQLPFHLIPGPAGLSVVNSRGEALHLGSDADVSAPVEATHAYPRAGEEVRVTSPLDDGAVISEVVVAWGDGAIDRQVPPEATTGLFREVNETTTLVFSHSYRQERDMDAAVTTVFDDGTTATEVVTFHVGKTPPPELNFMQRQFAPENQDRTWGLIGLAVALFGAAGAAWFRRRRHRRIRRHLILLDAIHEQSLQDPEGALKELDAVQRRTRELLMAGRIDDGEYRVIAVRAASISKRLHRRLLGPLSGKLTPEYRGQIESAFEDGFLSAKEAAHLLESIASESALTKADKVRLRRLITGWATEFELRP